MFDNVKCKAALPLPESLKDLPINWGEEVFQTKSMDNYMGTYVITEDAQLVELVIENEYVFYTEEEKKELDIKPWVVYKEVIEKSRQEKPVDYHGVVNFYTVVRRTEEKDQWVEFDAYFIYGKLDKIKLAIKHELCTN